MNSSTKHDDKLTKAFKAVQNLIDANRTGKITIHCDGFKVDKVTMETEIK